MKHRLKVVLFASAMAIWVSLATATENQLVDLATSKDSNSLGGQLPGTSTVVADIGMPPPEIASAIESLGKSPPLASVLFESAHDPAGFANVSMFDTVGQNGHYRNSVATVPPLISADQIIGNMSIAAHVDKAGLPTETITAYDTSQTALGWFGSGKKNTGAITTAANIVNSTGSQAHSSA